MKRAPAGTAAVSLVQPGSAPLRVIDHIQNFCLGLLVFSGAFVLIDAPYNIAFLLAGFTMLLAGFRLSLPLMPFIIVTMLYLLAGFSRSCRISISKFRAGT